jgi:hypothetical protein
MKWFCLTDRSRVGRRQVGLCGDECATIGDEAIARVDHAVHAIECSVSIEH